MKSISGQVLTDRPAFLSQLGGELPALNCPPADETELAQQAEMYLTAIGQPQAGPSERVLWEIWARTQTDD